MAISLSEYFAVVGSRYTDEDAKIIGPVLEDLSRQGKTTAADIVDAASPKESPIHRYFEWDDYKAAEMYRQEQARHMARSIVVKVITDEGKEEIVRAFHAVKIVTKEEKANKFEPKSYVHLTVLQDEPQMAEQIIDQAWMQLNTWKQKYAIYLQIFPSFNQKFKRVFDAIDEINAFDDFDHNLKITPLSIA